MNNKPEDYLKRPYSRILIPTEDGIFSAEILEFPGCYAQGKTPNEAFRNLEEAAESWIEAAIHQGLEIPEPSMNQGYGGRIALRLPRSLHRQAARMAERDDTSLNQFLVSAIAARVGAEDFYTYFSEKLERRIAATAVNIVVSWAVSTFAKPGSVTPHDRILKLEAPPESISAQVTATTKGSVEVWTNA